MNPTKVDLALAALEERHADDPERVELLRRTRRFKASWLELAQALADVRKGGTWERWGYDSFEAYTRGELKLRQETVDKLTGSFTFLHKRAPEILQRDPLDTPLPSYQAIDFLRRAEEKAEQDDTVSEETMVDLRKKVLEDGAPIATVSRLYKDTLFPVSATEKRDKDHQGLKSSAKKLKDLLAETHDISPGLCKTLIASLDELLAELGTDAKAA